MNGAPTNSPAIGFSDPKPGGGWSWRQIYILIALALLAHVVLIFLFGTKKQIVPQAVKNVPRLSLAGNVNELAELENPALFALPNPRDFASAVWLKAPSIPPKNFRWTENPRYLSPTAENFGAAFKRFMQTNHIAEFAFDFAPTPKFAQPVSPIAPALPQKSTLQIYGKLAQRKLLSSPDLPSLPYNDVIAASKVQVLVNRSGNLISAVVLPSDNPIEAAGRADIGDSNALIFARSLHFAPATQITIGQIIFNWHTVPVISTNAPAIP